MGSIRNFILGSCPALNRFHGSLLRWALHSMFLPKTSLNRGVGGASDFGQRWRGRSFERAPLWIQRSRHVPRGLNVFVTWVERRDVDVE